MRGMMAMFSHRDFWGAGDKTSEVSKTSGVCVGSETAVSAVMFGSSTVISIKLGLILQDFIHQNVVNPLFIHLFAYKGVAWG